MTPTPILISRLYRKSPKRFTYHPLSVVADSNLSLLDKMKLRLAIKAEMKALHLATSWATSPNSAFYYLMKHYHARWNKTQRRQIGEELFLDWESNSLSYKTHYLLRALDLISFKGAYRHD